MDGLRVYIAGPMESVGGNWNIPLFDFVTDELRKRGCEVFSPAEHLREMHLNLDLILKMDAPTRKMARREALKDELLWIIDNAQLVFMLPGWERSPGATAERAIALACGVEVRESGTIILPAGDFPGEMKLDPAPVVD